MVYTKKHYQEDTRFIKRDFSIIEDEKIIFFLGCEHFLNGTCSSTNWGPKTLCNKCYQEGSYKPFKIVKER